MTTRKVLAGMGSLAFQGNMRKWVMHHAQHHAHEDAPGDPHTPKEYPGIRGLLWAHIGWIFFEVLAPPGYTRKPSADPVFAWEKRWHNVIGVLGFVLPFVTGGWNGLLIGGALRVTLMLHITWSVDSFGHLGAIPRNTWPLAFANLSGEAWHKNHHTDQRCGFIGWKWWQVDIGKYLLIALEWLGLVWNIRRPKST